MTNQANSNEFPATAVVLQEALRNFVPSELWQAYEVAARARRGLPRRSVTYSAYLNGPRAFALNGLAVQIKTAEAATRLAWQRILAEFGSQLQTGKLTAYVREAFPFGPVVPIPPDAWRCLRITDMRSGRAKGGGVDLTGIRIAPGPPLLSHFGENRLETEFSSAKGQTWKTEFTANEDYTLVCIGTVEFRFVGLQTAIVRELHQASRTDDAWRHGKFLLHHVGASTRSIGDLFRRHREPSWRILIEDNRGMYRLRLQAQRDR